MGDPVFKTPEFVRVAREEQTLLHLVRNQRSRLDAMMSILVNPAIHVPWV